MFKVLLHKDFLARLSRVLRRYRSLNRPLINAFNRLENGPGSKHSPLKDTGDLGAPGSIRRMRVGNHRMIYRLDEREGAIVPLYLSDKPRNEATYRDWYRVARRIIVDFEDRQHDLFEEWQGDL